MKQIILRSSFVIVALFSSLNVFALNESEPNNGFPSANLTYQDSIMNAAANSATDQNDYFVTVLNDDGTIKLNYSYSPSSVTDDFYIYVYNKSGSLLSSNADHNVSLGTHSDSMYVYCRAADTVFIRINVSGSFSYNFQYKVLSSGIVDSTNNNSFSSPQIVNFADTTKGRIGYTSTSADNDDYYQLVLPDDGTLEYVFEFTNTTGSTTPDFYTYVYNKNGSLLNSSAHYNQAIGTFADTIYEHCMAQDTFYIRVTSSGCFSYEFYTNVIPSGVADSPNNESLSNAEVINFTAITQGRIGYTSGNGTDNDDYYQLVLPDDGTLEYVFEFTNTTGSTTPDFYTYVYNKNGSLLNSSAHYNQAIGTFTDTIYEHCMAQDTFYIRVTSSGCFSYQFHTNVIPSGVADSANNESLANAQVVNFTSTTQGRIGYTSGSGTDNNDYYQLVLPDDGTLEYLIEYTNTAGTTSPDFYTYVYNKGGSLLTSKAHYNQAIGTFNDTLYEHCMAQDTFYIRISSNQCFSYKFSTNVIPSGLADSVNNGGLATAQLVGFADTLQGRIGYTSGSGTDNNDYYEIVMPDDGTLEYVFEFTNTTGSTTPDFYTYVYNKNGSLLNSRAHYNQAIGTFTDTIYEHCMAKDTFYIRVASSGCFSYQFYLNVLDKGVDDVEPNNSVAEARFIDLKQILSGEIGHGTVNYDAYDYYKFYLPQYSSVQTEIEYENTSGTTSSNFFISLYNSNGSQVFSDANYNLATTIFSEQLAMECLPSDTFYLRINSSGCFNYSMKFKVKNEQPIAEIETFRIGNDFSFTANTFAADSYTWDLGDGTTSTDQFPKKTYDIGVYDVTLSATNQKCNLTDVDTFQVEVKGVEYFAPTYAGAGGDAMMQIFGGGLDTATKVTLKRGNLELTPTLKYGSEGRNELQVLMDLHFADEGYYDVIIEIPGEPAVTFPKGFEVTAFEYPYTYSEVTGPDRWRINRNTRFVLTIGNRGNVKATGVVAYLVWPKSVQIDWQTEWFSPPDSGVRRIEYLDTAFTANWEDLQMFYDSAFSAPIPLDSFAGEPFDGYAKMIWIQHIAPNATYDIPFLARANSSGQQPFITFTSKPNMFGSCGNGTYLSYIENGGIMFAEGLDAAVGNSPLAKTPVGWLTKATASTTKGLQNLGQVMGATYNYATGTTNSIYESLPADFNSNVSAQNAQTASAVVGLGVDKFVDVNANKILKGQQDRINKAVLNNPDMKIPSALLAADQLQTIEDIRNFVKNAYKTGKQIKQDAAKLEELIKKAEDCPELKKQLTTLKKELDKELKQREKKRKNSNTVVSMDPNAIYGPTGVLAQRYVNNTDRHNFLVTFENVDTATADAQVVIVNASLDTAAFDLSTFAFGDISIGSETYRVPKGRNEFMLDLDLMSSRGMFVRVHAKLYAEEAMVEWTFLSIDTTTGTFPILDGFLPPNINAPEGEGSVSYNVSLKENIVDGYNVMSTAEIVFDENDPIFTNTWENTVDVSPSSSTASSSIENDSIVINFNGSDALSGVDYYYLYVSMDDGKTWEALQGSVYDRLVFAGEVGVEYSFYSVSTDKVGNEEIKSPTIETTISLVPKESDFNPSFQLYPNPLGNGKLKIKSNGNYPATEIYVYDVLGKRVRYAKTNIVRGNDAEVDLGNLPSGVYSLYFKTEQGKTTANKLVISKTR